MPLAALFSLPAAAQMIAVAAYTSRGKEIYREETHTELVREYERIFAWKKHAYEMRFEFGPDPGAPPVALLVLEHPHALDPRPYTVTLQLASFGEPLSPERPQEFTLPSSQLTFKIWFVEESGPPP